MWNVLIPHISEVVDPIDIAPVPALWQFLLGDHYNIFIGLVVPHRRWFFVLVGVNSCTGCGGNKCNGKAFHINY